MTDEFPELPADLRTLTRLGALANKYPNHIPIDDRNRGNGNPSIREQLRQVYGAELKEFGISLSDSTLMTFLRLIPEAHFVTIRVRPSKTGNSFTMSMTKILKALKLKVPKGRIMLVPARVFANPGGLGPCLFLDFQHQDTIPAPPKVARAKRKVKTP